jgi:dUTP pyrophosphatase
MRVTLKVKFKKLLPDIPTPEYQTPGAAAFDIAAAEDVQSASHMHAYVRTGLVVECPIGTYLALAPRSSLFKRTKLLMPNSPAIIDPDYSGDTDEIHLSLYNTSNVVVEIKKGDRLAQGIFLPFYRVEFTEVSNSLGDSRGGLGSTGV